MKVNGIMTRILIDSGATDSAISLKLLECFPNYKQYVCRTQSRTCVSVNGNALESLYTVKLPIVMKGGKCFHTELEVIDSLIHPVLLGTDFLRTQKAVIDFQNEKLIIGKYSCPIGGPCQAPSKPPHLASIDDVLLPPNTISLVRAEILGFTTENAECLSIGPFEYEMGQHPEILTAHSIIDPNTDELWVEVMNPSSSPIHITQNCPIAQIFEVDPEIVVTEMSRDLSEMPSEIDEQTEPEDHCGGVEEILVDDVPDTVHENLESGAASQPLSSSPPQPPPSHHFTPAFVDGHFASISSKAPARDAQAPQAGGTLNGSYAFRPSGILTRNGVIPIKYDPPLIANLESNKTDTDSQPDCLPDSKPYEPTTEGSMFEGDDLIALKELLHKHKAAFASHPEDIGKTSLVHHYAKLTTDKPIYVKNYRSPPPKIKDQIKTETDRLMAAGIIRQSESPYSAPIVLVRKPDQTWRYCTDFRRLNKITEPMHFPIPNISDRIRQFKNPKVFSSLDLLKGFFQIPIAEPHCKYFGFSDGNRHLEYCRCPMGSKNSGATMASLVELVFRGFPSHFLLAYFDDILIATPTAALHLELLDKVLTAITRAGLKLNPLKCKFAQGSITTLGYVLSADGINPDPNNLRKIREWPAPKNQKQVRQFIGLCSYYRAHLPDFAKIATPLTDLLCKDAKFVWSKLEQSAFEKLRENLLNGTACTYPDFSKQFILKCDGSGNCVGAVLSQRDERGKECIVACASRKLNETQAKWACYDKEFFALIFGVRSFSHYLRFQKFLILTDHKPLLSCIDINPKLDSNGKRTRWSLELQGYSFDIAYKKGSQNTDADALSRCPMPDPPSPSDDDELMIVGAVTAEETPLAQLTTDDNFQKRIYDEQRKHKHYSQIIQKLIERDDSKPVCGKELVDAFKDDTKLYALIDGILHISEMDRIDEMNRARVVVPPALIVDFLDRSHGDLVAGHAGEKRTYARLSKFCYWPGMRKDVCNKVRTCEVCQSARPNRMSKMVPVKPQRARFPLDVVQADLVKFFPPSHGYQYVMVMEDRFSKYCCLYPLRGKSTTLVAKALTQFVTRFGCPISWQTDNGGEFKSNLISALCATYNIRKTFSLAYHPASNGQCERKNRTLIAELSKRVRQYGGDWSSQLKWVEFGLNTTPHTSTGFSPHMMMFGRDARTPFETQLPPVVMDGWDGDTKRYFIDHQRQLEKAHSLAREYHDKYMEDMVKHTSKHGTQGPFPVGAQVWKLIPTEARHKLSVNYDGPWLVTERVGNTYKLSKDGEVCHRPQVDLKIYEKPMFEKNKQEVQQGLVNEKVHKDDGVNDLSKWLTMAHLITGGGLGINIDSQTPPSAPVAPIAPISSPIPTRVSLPLTTSTPNLSPKAFATPPVPSLPIDPDSSLQLSHVPLAQNIVHTPPQPQANGQKVDSEIGIPNIQPIGLDAEGLDDTIAYSDAEGIADVTPPGNWDEIELESESSPVRRVEEQNSASKIPVLNPRVSSQVRPIPDNSISTPVKSTALTREMRRLAGVNQPGRKEAPLEDVLSKRKSKYRK